MISEGHQLHQSGLLPTSILMVDSSSLQLCILALSICWLFERLIIGGENEKVLEIGKILIEVF